MLRSLSVNKGLWTQRQADSSYYSKVFELGTGQLRIFGRRVGRVLGLGSSIFALFVSALEGVAGF